MSVDTTPSRLAADAGISVPYASQILSGARAPSRRLALSIFEKTGERFGPIASLSDEDIATLARIEAATQVTVYDPRQDSAQQEAA